MARQLLLPGTDRPDWHLDAPTCESGRKGIARARAILALHAPPTPDGEPEAKPGKRAA